MCPFMAELLVPRELHGKRLFGYNLGYFGMYLTNVFIDVFVFQFYVYTINLNSLLVSIGISLKLIIAALSAIIFGVMADNKKSGKFGKRRPFLFYGLPIWFITSVLLWLPPWKCPQNNSFYWPTAIYLWCILILNIISLMSMMSPHASMLPEQSQTYKNQEKVASVGTFLTIIASILALLFPLIMQSMLEDPQKVKWWEPSGKLVLLYIPLISLGFGIFAIISIILAFFSVDESFHKIGYDLKAKKSSVLAKFHQMTIPGKDKKFKHFIWMGFFTTISSQILGILVIPFLTYSLEFRGSQYFIYIIVSFLCKFGWFYVWKKILQKHALIKTYSLCILSSVIASLLELIFLIEMLSFEFKMIIFIITMGTILGAIYGFGLFSGPLASALIYEAASKDNEADNIDKAVSKISGAYFGLNSFLLSISRAVASIMIGVILIGPNQENPTIITLCLSSMGIFFLIGLIFLRKIELKEEISIQRPFTAK
jgi:Na+/melibiose symporter-like transporter